MKRRVTHLQPSIVLPILQARAEERGTLKGHVLGPWQPAKKRFGKMAMKTVCELCGLQAVAMPSGEAGARVNIVRDNPGLLGDVLLEPCISTKVVDPPPGSLGLRGR